MIYLRVKPRVMARVGERLTLSQVADVLAGAELRLGEMRIDLPNRSGIWQIDALRLIMQIRETYPQETINVLGDGVGWLHRETRGERRAKDERRPGYLLRVALVCLLLACGSALTIAWFHADVNMPEAQRTLFHAIAGEEAKSPLLIAVPYALGVGAGVALYYALIGRKTVSPLSIKLREYRENVERNAK